MMILGIESSCDETAIALLQERDGVFEVKKNLLTSQVATHALYGGVVPEVAAREHVDILFPMLKASGISPDGEGIDVIAVTAGPGLVPALRVGVELAKVLAWLWHKPLVAVNHLEGHIYSVWGGEKKPMFPALCLLVSGGHTELILMKDHGQYELIGMTRDDAAGEAFDKVAKLLELPYPGGPEISKAAEKGNPTAVDFPRPMLNSGDFDFSFSGLKTAVRNEVALQQHSVEDIAASFQEAVVDTLVTKTMKAMAYTGAQSLILSGGVSANKTLRSRLESTLQKHIPEVGFFAPDLTLTGDNAVMIALAGAYRFHAGETVDPLTLVANPNQRLA